MPQMTKKGARSVTQSLDRIASLMQEEHAALGVPAHIASDMAYRCDLLSDTIERNAGIDRKALDELDVAKEEGFDPEDIGEEKAGPLEDEPDESYMTGEFTQQENRELREKVQGGELGSDKTSPEPQAPRPGVQASDLTDLTKFAAGSENPHVARAIKLALAVAVASAEEEAEEEADEKKGGKKKAARKRASHGFRLNA